MKFEHYDFRHVKDVNENLTIFSKIGIFNCTLRLPSQPPYLSATANVPGLTCKFTSKQYCSSYRLRGYCKKMQWKSSYNDNSLFGQVVEIHDSTSLRVSCTCTCTCNYVTNRWKDSRISEQRYFCAVLVRISLTPPNAHNIADVIVVIDDYYDDVSAYVGPQHEPNKNTQLCAVTYTYLARLLWVQQVAQERPQNQVYMLKQPLSQLRIVSVRWAK